MVSVSIGITTYSFADCSRFIPFNLGSEISTNFSFDTLLLTQDAHSGPAIWEPNRFLERFVAARLARHHVRFTFDFPRCFIKLFLPATLLAGTSRYSLAVKLTKFPVCFLNINHLVCTDGTGTISLSCVVR